MPDSLLAATLPINQSLGQNILVVYSDGLAYTLWFGTVPQNEMMENKKLSYRKEIACHLHTQYVEGIYSNPMTLKSRLRVTKGH